MLRDKLKKVLTLRTAATVIAIAGAVCVTYGFALLWAPAIWFVGGTFCLWFSWAIECDVARREAPTPARGTASGSRPSPSVYGLLGPQSFERRVV